MEKKKVFSYISIFLIFSSGLVILNLTADSSNNYLIREKANQDLMEYVQTYRWSDDMIEEEMQNILQSTCQNILSNQKYPLETRYMIATIISNFFKTDLPILYLISTELAHAFEGEIRPLHHGYLVTNGDWAILVEHGFSLLLSKRSGEIVRELSENYSWVLLASCNSKIIADYYANVEGFSTEITIETIYDYLRQKLPYRTMNSIRECELKNFQLIVTAQDSFSVGWSVFLGIIAISASNIFQGYIATNPFKVSLRTGDSSWGVTHINEKSEKVHLNNAVLTELLKGKALWFTFQTPICKYRKLVVFKKDMKASVFPVYKDFQGASITWALIGWEGPGFNEPRGIKLKYTIRSAGIIGKREQGNPNPTPGLILDGYIFDLENHKWSHKDIKRRRGYELPSAFYTAPLVIAALSIEVLEGIIETPPNEDPAESPNANTWFWRFFGIIIIAALIIFAIGSAALGFPQGTYTAGIIAIGLIFYFFFPASPTASAAAVIDPFEGDSWDNYDGEVIEDVIETDFMNCYDDDNDGITNIMEANYYELYVADALDGPYSLTSDNPLDEIPVDYRETWVDPDTDYDNDGLLTITEILYSSDPFKSDTDGDGLLDGQEIQCTGTPETISMMLTDSDRDGFLDNQTITKQGEISIRSDPSAFDSDLDGLGDWEENYLGLGKFDRDSDNDTLLDGWEVYTYSVKWQGGPDEDYSYYRDFVDPEVAPASPTWVGEDLDDDGLNNTMESRFFTNPYSSDTDGDGISDKWEIDNNLDPTNPNDADYDHDGDDLSTLLEATLYETNFLSDDSDEDGWSDDFEINTSFTDPNLNDTDGDGMLDVEEYNYWCSLGVDSATAYSYCNNSDVDDDNLLDGEESTYNCDPLDADSDNDGLLDGNEINSHNTNPLLIDTDSDGMDDKFEVDYGLNPLVNDASGDPDNDDLSNVEEHDNLTDPTDSDTDGDGIPDGWEVTYSLNPLIDDALTHSDTDNLYNIDEYTYGTDPFDPDCDNDGLNDKLEIFTYNTDPWDSDTDNDGWSDYYEVYTSGTDPADADTDNDGISDKTEYNWWRNTYGQSSSSAYNKIKDYDTDNDGLSDGWEKSHGINPLDNDCDNDGLLDGLEVNNYQTDPEDPDSDNDGYTDLYEIINGTDPNDPTDYPGGGWSW